jgi:hypothetical protein
MTTKDQESKVLEQIRKLVAGLGEDSYVAKAFEGCFEIAEDNITNNFACSMKQRAESAEKECKGMGEGSALGVCLSASQQGRRILCTS